MFTGLLFILAKISSTLLPTTNQYRIWYYHAEVSFSPAEAQNDESRRLPKEAAALRCACARSRSEINAWSTAVRDVPCADQPSYAQLHEHLG